MYKLYGQKSKWSFTKLSSFAGVSVLVSQLVIAAVVSVSAFTALVSAAPGDPVLNVQDNEYFVDIQTALDAATFDDGETLQLQSSISTSAQVTIISPFTLDGNGYTVSPTFSKSSNSNNSVFGITGTNNVRIQNITIDGSGGTELHGVNAYQSSNVSLNDLTIQNMSRSAVVANRSSITIDTITTSGNGTEAFYWSVIDVSGVTGEPASLTISGDVFQSEAAPRAHIVRVDGTPSTVNDVNNLYSVNDVISGATFKVYRLADRQAPSTPTITKPGPRQWFKTSPITAEWTAATDSESGVENYEIEYVYMLNGVETTAIRNAGNNLSRDQQLSGNVHSKFTIRVRAIDTAGNIGEWSQPVFYYYDSQSPTTTRVVEGVNAGFVDNRFTVSGEASDNLALNRMYVQLVNRDDSKRYGGTTINLIPDGTESSWSRDYNAKAMNLPNGVYAAHVTVVDMAGNTMSSGWSDNFTLDSDLPTMDNLRMFVKQSNGNYTLSENVRPGDEVRIEVEANDTLSGVSYVEFRVKNATGGGYVARVEKPNAASRDTVYRYEFAVPSDGMYIDTHQPITQGLEGLSYWARAYDVAGNYSNGLSDRFTYDSVAPEVPTEIYTQDSDDARVLSEGATNSQEFTFSLDSSPDTVRYQLKYWNNIPGSVFKEATPWNPTSLDAFSSALGVYSDNFTQGNGLHLFSFSACDAAGNCSEYSTPFEITFDNNAPVITYGTITSTNTSPAILGSVAAGMTDTTEVTIQIEGDATVYQATMTTPEAWLLAENTVTPELSVGSYNVTVTVTDAAGNVTIKTYSDGLVINPVVQPPAGSSPDTPTETQDDQAVLAAVAPVAQRFGGVGGNNPVNNNAVLSATDVAQADTNDNDESQNPQVLQSAIDNGEVSNEEIADKITEDGCFEIFAICWYWYAIPVIALIGYGFYRVAKDDK